MSNIRTVSDTKRAFYTSHTRPISSIYRRVVEELMVEMHLLSVNAEFQYDPIYALGVVTSFDRFMQGYRPEEDVTSIFQAICNALGGASADQYRSDAGIILDTASQLSKEDFGALIDHAGESEGSGLQSSLGTIAKAEHFKYSRLFAIGLLTVLESVDSSILENETQLGEWTQRLSERLKLPKEKVDKDLELYRGNLEKLRQAREVLDDVLKADRKKREERQSEPESTDSGEPKDASSSDGSDDGAIASPSES